MRLFVGSVLSLYILLTFPVNSSRLPCNHMSMGQNRSRGVSSLLLLTAHDALGLEGGRRRDLTSTSPTHVSYEPTLPATRLAHHFINGEAGI
jgi:hypothetical protein